jgi:hypothetical protein
MSGINLTDQLLHSFDWEKAAEQMVYKLYKPIFQTLEYLDFKCYNNKVQ